MKNLELHVEEELTRYFAVELKEISRKQGLSLEHPITIYLASLLKRFTHTDKYLVEDAASNKLTKPTLATLWLESKKENTFEQYLKMQYLGDFALFTTGFFGENIKSSALDMDYFIAMGGKAYARAGAIQESIAAERDLNVFFELSSSFVRFMEVISELALKSRLHDNKELIKLYETWLKTKSYRLERILNEKGIIPQAPDWGDDKC
jgi:hypothetical protein